MRRRSWAIAILVAWVLSLGWLVRREVFRSTGARLAAAALAVPPGAMFYRLDLGSQQVGFLTSTLDTLPDSIRVENLFVLDVAAVGKLQRTSVRSIAMLSRALRLQRLDATFDGDIGQFAAHGRVLGDSVLAVAIVSGGGTDSQITRIPLTGPITLPTLLPLRLAFGGELEPGRTYGARLFDPLLLAERDVRVRVAAESTLVVSDSADLDSTTMVWIAEHFDTVRAFRIDQDAHGVTTSSWIDAQGRLVRSSNTVGFAMERAAFEIAYGNFRRRDTARVARSSAAPRPGDIVPVTALAAGVTGAPANVASLRVRFTGEGGLPAWTGGRQNVAGDTLVVTREGSLQAHATPYRLPASDTALRRWLMPEPLIQSQDPRIAAQARTILGSGRTRERNPARAAEILTHWVHQSVRRTTGPDQFPSAQRVLETRRGDCNEATTLYVALARAAGLPARTVAGLIHLNGRFYYHAWPEVYLGAWVAVDPTFDQYPADASHLRFAIGGLARQVELVPLIGRLKLEVL